MTQDVIKASVWTRRRWLTAVGLVLGFQVLLISLLERHSHGMSRKTVAALEVHWLKDISLVSLAVNDPTLFVLPHREGFSGGAWLNKVYSPNFRAPAWTEAPRLLALSAETLGASFGEFVAANSQHSFQAIAAEAPALDMPEHNAFTMPPTESKLELEGSLKRRRLLAPPDLQSWTNADVLTNSIVQLFVNARGNVIQSVLLQGCGLKDADDLAMKLSKAARFEPITDDANSATVGKMIFEWKTVPPMTNGVPAID
jgi:hypothetical protein